MFYVEKILERYFAALQEIKTLQQIDFALEIPVAQQPAPEPALLDIDMHHTTLLATQEQHAPLQAWFAARQIEARFDYALLDTRGFFDDAACMIGEHYALFADLMEKVRLAYRQSYSGVNLELAGLNHKDAQAINQLCRQLYSHTFFARYHYRKSQKIVRLTLQTAPAIRQFFDGGWLEWYALIELLKQTQERGRAFSCARGVRVVFPDDGLHELNVVCLPEGEPPILIECQSREFHRDIDRYVHLRERLDLHRSRFIICAPDLTPQEAQSLSAMHPLTFVNLSMLGPHLAQLAA